MVKYIHIRALKEDFKVNVLQQKEAEIEALKSKLKKKEAEILRQPIAVEPDEKILVPAWIIKGAGLLKPLMLEMKKELQENDLLHADETTLEVIHEPGRPSTSKSYIWVYRTSACTRHPVICAAVWFMRNGNFMMRGRYPMATKLPKQVKTTYRNCLSQKARQTSGGYSEEERLKLRQTESKVVLEEFYDWIEQTALQMN